MHRKILNSWRNLSKSIPNDKTNAIKIALRKCTDFFSARFALFNITNRHLVMGTNTAYSFICGSKQKH